jgi:hypothetical protein
MYIYIVVSYTYTYTYTCKYSLEKCNTFWDSNLIHCQKQNVEGTVNVLYRQESILAIFVFPDKKITMYGIFGVL